MTNLPEVLQACLRLFLVGVLALLAGCGPGVGGTGTGPTPGGGGQLPDQPAILFMTFSAPCPGCALVVLDLAQDVTLATGCRTFFSMGNWNGQSQLVLDGILQTASVSGTTTTAATLTVEFDTVAANTQVAIVDLRDAANQVVVDSLELQRNDAAVAPPVTPCP